MRLQRLDLMADRGLGDAQFFRRAGEAQMAGGGFEGAQGVEGQLAEWNFDPLRPSLAPEPATATSPSVALRAEGEGRAVIR